MKKILDRYKIPGFERRVISYVINRGNAFDKSVQLSMDPRLIEDKGTKDKPNNKPRDEEYTVSDKYVQLTLEIDFESI
ncbi:hypothetical protein [Niallia sp. MER TA 168]|uniref:hypothetical protein n=1 Tax=Niallia sp. MER TA 168 TaxID=2939568 RepID=UPI00203ED288|nr:hypothetical protein [Niallia sp. MER TA 168]MCM3362246.1 hypothetical protein [Niallia sp. MER TA 168]